MTLTSDVFVGIGDNLSYRTDFILSTFNRSEIQFIKLICTFILQIQCTTTLKNSFLNVKLKDYVMLFLFTYAFNFYVEKKSTFFFYFITLKVALGVSPQFFSIWIRVLNHNKYVEIKQISKEDIKQNNISTVILLIKFLVYQWDPRHLQGSRLVYIFIYTLYSCSI